jgi:hypothetical protein
MKWIIKILAGGFGIIGLMFLYFSFAFLFLGEQIGIFSIIILSSIFFVMAIFCLLLSWLVIKKYRDEDVKALSIALGITVYALIGPIFQDNQSLLSRFNKTYIDKGIIVLAPIILGIICHKVFYSLYLKSKEKKSNEVVSPNSDSAVAQPE